MSEYEEIYIDELRNLAKLGIDINYQYVGEKDKPGLQTEPGQSYNFGFANAGYEKPSMRRKPGQAYNYGFAGTRFDIKEEDPDNYGFVTHGDIPYNPLIIGFNFAGMRDLNARSRPSGDPFGKGFGFASIED